MIWAYGHHHLLLLLQLIPFLAHLARRAIMSYCHTNVSACLVRRPLTLENKYSNIFFYKTTGPTVLKFHMKHDLTHGLRIVKLGKVEYPRWPLLLKKEKQQNKLLLQNHCIFLAQFSHLGIFVTTGCSSRRQYVTAVRLDIFRSIWHK